MSFGCTGRTRLSAVAFAAILFGSASSQTIPETIDAALDTSATIRPYKWGMLFEDEIGSSEYYARNPATGMIPASNTKIFTTAAAFGLLGENYEFRTRIYRSAGTIASGVFTGNIVIIGEHDPTWNATVFGNGNEDEALQIAADATVAALASQGITQVNGRVEGRGAMYIDLDATNTNHVSLSTTTVSNLNLAVANAFRTALVEQGLVFTQNIASAGFTGFAPDGSWTLLHTHMSGDANDGGPLTLANACVSLNKVSHNVMADFLMRHIGYHISGTDTYAAGVAQALPWFSGTAGVTTAGLVLNDGSGLSTGNRISARQTVDLLRYMAFSYPNWGATLPISCVDGTLGGRLCGSLSGDVHAKTGTLPNTGVVSLSGWIDHPLDAQRYFFSIYCNTPGATSGGQAIDDALARTAIDAAVRAVGDRRPPYAPTLLAALPDGANARLEWADPDLALASYSVASSTDGASYAPAATIAPAYIIETGRSDNAGGLHRADFTFTGNFENSVSHSAAPGLTAGIGSRFLRPTSGTGSAIFTPSALPTGRYRVDVTCYDVASANATNAQCVLVDRNGTRTTTFALTEQTAGNVWRVVGAIDFVAGQGHRVEFRNNVQTSTGTDDRLNPAAVRFTPLFATLPIGVGEWRSYRVAARGPAGEDSPFSDAYAVARRNSSRILVVDGYDRWETQTNQNALRENHPFAATTARSIPDRTVGTVANETLATTMASLADWRVAVWVLGEESTVNETFDAAEQTRVSAYLAGGGALFASGAEILWDLDRVSGPTAADRAFAKAALRAEYDDARSDALNDDAATSTTSGVAGSIFAPLGTVAFDGGGGGIYGVEFPDVLKTVGAGSVPVLAYQGGTSPNLPAAIAYDGTAGSGRVVLLGFPFETITSPAKRDQLMAIALDFLDPPTAAETGDLWMLR